MLTLFSVWKSRYGMEGEYFSESNLKCFSLKTLRCLVTEMNAEIQKTSQHLVHTLVERDKTAKLTQDREDRVTEVLAKYAEANGISSNFKFYLQFTSYYSEQEYNKWLCGWSLVSQVDRGILKYWRKRVWESVAVYTTKDILWDQVLHHILQNKTINEREREWKRCVQTSIEQLRNVVVDGSIVENVLVSYCRLFPKSTYCTEFTTLASIAVAMCRDGELALKVLVTLLEHKLPPQYFGDGFQSVKSDMAVLSDLIKHFLPMLHSHIETLRAKRSSKVLKSYSFLNPPDNNDYTAFEPPLVDALSLQWLLSCFTVCLPWKIVTRLFDCILIDGSEMLLYAALAIWSLMESDLLKVDSVSDFYERSSEFVRSLKAGEIVSPTDFIQIIYTLKQCATVKGEGLTINELRQRHSYSPTQRRSTPVCPPPSQGGSFTMSPMCHTSICQAHTSSSPQHYEVVNEISPITALAECPQTKKSGFIFSYAYAADVPADLPVKYALKMSKNCTQLLKNGMIFNMGDYETDAMYLFSSP